MFSRFLRGVVSEGIRRSGSTRGLTCSREGRTPARTATRRGIRFCGDFTRACHRTPRFPVSAFLTSFPARVYSLLDDRAPPGSRSPHGWSPQIKDGPEARRTDRRRTGSRRRESCDSTARCSVRRFVGLGGLRMRVRVWRRLKAGFCSPHRRSRSPIRTTREPALCGRRFSTPTPTWAPTRLFSASTTSRPFIRFSSLPAPCRRSPTRFSSMGTRRAVPARHRW